jgi:hypothetical protein
MEAEVLKRLIVYSALLCLLLVGSGIAQDLSTRLGNKEIIDMVGLGLPDDVIIEKIRTAPEVKFDTSIEGLKALKAAKVSDAVIKQMINPKAAPAGAPVAAAEKEVADPNLPPKEVGVYWQDPNVTTKFTALDGQNIAQAKMGGRWASMGTMGLKSKHWNAYVRGPQARVRITTRRPVFYVYVLEGNNASDYVLVKLDKKDDRRQFEVGSIGGLVGGKSGLRDENMRAFDSERVALRTYKITVKEDLAPGEYGFFLAQSQQMAQGGGGETAGNAQGRLYDFSVIE